MAESLALGSIRKSIGNVLTRNGLANCHSPRELFQQLAKHITGHEQYRELLLQYEPTKRATMYEAMLGHLSFQPKPLADYIAEGRILADDQKLPRFDYIKGTITPYENDGMSAEEVATKAIQSELTKLKLIMTCGRCTREDQYNLKPGQKRFELIALARKDGWVIVKGLDGEDQERCPVCAPKPAVTLN